MDDVRGFNLLTNKNNKFLIILIIINCFSAITTYYCAPISNFILR